MNGLNRPPIAVAIFQIRYESGEIQLKDFVSLDQRIKHHLPIRRENIHVGINLNNTSIPLGESQLSAKSNAAIDAYIYQSVDQKTKLEISNGTITLVEEHPYEGWDVFKGSVIQYLNILSELLNRVTVSRLSIRFINKFSLNDFDHPEEYFTTLITDSTRHGLPYPLNKYGFRLVMDIPDSEIYSIVNQNVENVGDRSFSYTFDIDVLDRQTLAFDLNTISANIEALRAIKNKIFFDGITQKTIDLCN